MTDVSLLVDDGFKIDRYLTSCMITWGNKVIEHVCGIEFEKKLSLRQLFQAKFSKVQ